MRIPDAKGEVLMFWSAFIKIVASGDFFMAEPLNGERELTIRRSPTVSQRIEDAESGEDITGLVRGLVVHNSLKRSWAELELMRPGFDGPFCVPSVGFGGNFQSGV